MCFRPAEADTTPPIECPGCGNRINPVQNVYPVQCPFCQYENPSETGKPITAPAPNAAPAASPAPAAPNAPKAPSVPKAPTD